VLLDEAAVPGVQAFARHALRVHNNVSTIKSPSLYFKLDNYEKVVDSTDSYHLTQASLSLASCFFFLNICLF